MINIKEENAKIERMRKRYLREGKRKMKGKNKRKKDSKMRLREGEKGSDRDKGERCQERE